jgi:TRAP-type mannitol/chloroaromatic compound transport system substrate-binding protein
MTIINLPGGELFAALQSGAIDATEWVGPYNDLAFGFHKVAKYYYWPGMHEGGTTLEVTVDKKKFTALPKDVQRIFEECCKAEADKLLSEFNGRNGQALQTLIQQYNVQLKRFPNDFLVAYGNAAGEVIQEMLDDKDPLTREVTQSYLKSRRELMAWNRIAEQGYMNARLLDIKFPG